MALCQARQRRIIADVWPALAPGGMLIYSTCTFNRLENDSNVKWVEAELGAECVFGDYVTDDFKGLIRTECGCSLVPGFVDGEGQYCSVLRKGRGSCADGTPRQGKNMRMTRAPKKEQVPKSVERLVNVPCSFRTRGGTVVAVPSGITADVASLGEALHVLAAGCAIGMLKGSDLVPDADLALSLIFASDAFPRVEVDRNVALAYLHRDALTFPEAPKGYLTIVYDGLPLGFVKNLGNRCNNLYPQGRRIRMDIKI